MPERPFVVFTHGYTACMKTYVARRISNELAVFLIETNKLGPCTSSDGLLDEQLRARRYDAALHIARAVSGMMHTFGRIPLD